MGATDEQHDGPSRAEFHAAITARSTAWYSACLKITRNAELAADAVQDALLSAWEKRHQYDRQARLETWIHRIAVNAALALLRKQRPAFATEIDELDSNAPRPEQDVEDAALAGRLSRQLARLSELERVCFVLKHLEQWRAREIAETLGTREGRVKQAVFRAVGKLRISMSELQEVSNERSA